MKVLITGGAGFMGSHFIKYLFEHYQGAEALNIDSLTYASSLDRLRDVQKKYNRRYTFIEGNITDAALVSRMFKVWKPEFLIDFAAETHVDRSIMKPGEFIKTDVMGTYTLLEACRKFGIQRYLKVSTDEVFGSIKKGKFTEESPFKPNSPYSASKAGGDLLCHAYYVTYKVPVLVTHFCNFFGPWQHPEKFIPLFITNILENKKVPLYGQGRQHREWIYTEDVNQALDVVLQKGIPGEVYNCGTGLYKENWEVAIQILTSLGKGEDSIMRITDRPGHDFRYAVDWTKIKKLGFTPRYGFNKGLRETIEWYKKNRSWWERIKKSQEFQAYYKRQYPQL